MSGTPGNKGGIAKGFFLGIGMSIVQALLTWGIVAGTKSLTAIVFGMLFFGLIQLVYVVPVWRFLGKSNPPMATGLAIEACLVALVNITCATTMR